MSIATPTSRKTRSPQPFSRVPLAVLEDPELLDTDRTLFAWLMRLAGDFRVWAKNTELARLLRVSVGTIKNAIGRLTERGHLLKRPPKSGDPDGARNAKRVLILKWLAPASEIGPPPPVQRTFDFAPSGVNGLPSEGSTDCPQEAVPPYRKDLEREIKNSSAPPPEISPPKTPEPAGLPAPSSDPVTAVAREAADQITRIVPAAKADPTFTGRLFGLARSLGDQARAYFSPAIQVLERKAEREDIHDPVRYLAGTIRGFQRDGGPPPLRSEVVRREPTWPEPTPPSRELALEPIPPAPAPVEIDEAERQRRIPDWAKAHMARAKRCTARMDATR